MPNEPSYQDANAAAITRWIAEGWEWGQPISRETFANARAGEWSMVLTPHKPVPKSWFGELAGKQVLGLASGGGQQGPTFVAAGAEVTILDYTQAQLDAEALVAEREGYDINLVRADMTKPLPFESNTFDLVFNPISICYIREVEPLWAEVARILKPGGTFLTAFDTIINYLVDGTEERIVWEQPFDPLLNPAQQAYLNEDDSGVQFGHNLTETVGGLLKAGLVIDDLYEDVNDSGRLKDMNIPTYLAIKARKPE